MSCGNKQYQPAEDALDAAREFKNACLIGDFEKAKFYVKSTEYNTVALEDIMKRYKTTGSEQKKELKDASLRVISNKEIDSVSSQIILSNSFDKKVDTFFAVKENNSWLVDFKK
jgi:aminoglycoside N3'-acetyltransferase